LKFSGDSRETSVFEHFLERNDLPDAGVDFLVRILKNVSRQVGDETRERLRAAIMPPQYELPKDGRISFRDTPVFGHFYVYLWFSLSGDLFYIGKGTGNRAESLQGRSAEFKEKAASGYCKILADDMSEDYALDLEKILLLECALQKKSLANRMNGDAADAMEYCSGDRDVLLWYWNRLGVISRFSELTGINVFYDATGNRVASDFSKSSALDERLVWWRYYNMHPETNDPRILNEIRAAEEKKQRQKEKRREYARKRKEKLSAEATI
jgi:hypothetical protein